VLREGGSLRRTASKPHSSGFAYIELTLFIVPFLIGLFTKYSVLFHLIFSDGLRGKTMNFKLSILILLLCCGLTAAGCALFVVGAGTGAGVYTYMNGELKRSYQAPFDRTVEACSTALEDLKMSVCEKTSDGIHTQIKAVRSDSKPVTVKVATIEPKITEVSVRTGIVGIWDKQGSELVHVSIAKRLREQ
jgi:hypothetical protein